jgi:hypothetical protein
MTRLVAGPLDRCCDTCTGGLTKMVQVPRTKTWICSICSGSDWHYATDLQQQTNGLTEIEEEYQIEVK